ncbi:hypothetical protein [Stakelama saccharophila]|uniref:HEAT repeat domain-containing protein n=1 Tax=Stakelama saccharophila TaxID=3075605 RepID=A0ABZ0B959_9SPHN|nr:hypothetical protein [Stakelama sp. W311]WNO53908.1 hypothetical protein RPR59_01210 [Stakelama sp. W311]
MIDARRRSADFAADWAESGPVRRAAADFADGGDEATLIARARQLLRDPGWLEAMLFPAVAALARDPFFEPPFRVDRDAVRTGAILFENDRVRIACTHWSARALARRGAPSAVVVPGRLTVSAYVHAGEALLERWEAGVAGDDFRAASAPPARRLKPVRLHDGRVVVQDGRHRAHRIVRASRDLLSVGVTLLAGQAAIAREYRRADGRLSRVAMLDARPARSAMLLTLLRELGAAGAGECFRDASHDPAFFLRWEAMRQWLAHDAAAALPRLADMAHGDPHPEVRAAAAGMLPAVRRRLDGERLPCPA